jgi:uncharacterized protein (UPF0332 family)
MNEAFRECLKKRRIIPHPSAKKLVKRELSAAKDDLDEANDRLKYGKYKYATINSYYSIFHSARALLYSKGYRERSHHCLSVALDVMFVQTKKMSIHYITILRNSMSLRERADYSSTYSKDSAILSVLNAQDFLQMTRKIINQDFTPI